MDKRNLPSDQEIARIQVSLPRLFGMEPVKYIIPAYSLVIVLLLLVVLVIPGLINPGRHARITASVEGASVYLDGTRIGATPLDHYLPAGTHTIEFRSPYFAPVSTDIAVHPQIVGTLFGWFSKDFAGTMSLAFPEEFLADRVAEYSRWSLSPQNAVNYHVPRVLAPAIASYLAHGQAQSASDERLPAFFRSTALHMGNSTQASDWIEAWKLAYGHAENGSALVLLHALGLLDDAHFGTMLQEAFGPPSASTGDEGTEPESTAVVKAKGSRTITGRSFSVFSTDSGLEFMVADQEVDQELFGMFIKANPEWAPQATVSASPPRDGSTQYLADYAGGIPADPSHPMNQVTLPAAVAFLEWFTGTLAATKGVEGYKAFLPTRKDWNTLDTAIRPLAGSGPWLIPSEGYKSLYPLQDGMVRHWTGGMFEWSSESASLHKPVSLEDRMAAARFPGFQYWLLGGGFSIQSGTWTSDQDYALPADWASPTTGFRIWLAPEGRTGL